MADYSAMHAVGGQKSAAVAAGSGAADVVVSAKPGRITKLVFTAAGTAALKLYDHASASSGAKLLWVSATTPAAGDVITLDIPVDNGCVALQANGTGACTVYFTEDTVAGSGASDKSKPVSYGGQHTSYHAAGASGAAAALAAPGRLCRVVVLAAGTAATNIYDNASAASGTKLYTLPASPTVGTIYDLQFPAANGIYVGGATNTSSILVTYTKNTPYGR